MQITMAEDFGVADRGSWGPASADKLLAGHPSWRDPWIRRHG